MKGRPEMKLTNHHNKTAAQAVNKPVNHRIASYKNHESGLLITS